MTLLAITGLALLAIGILWHRLAGDDIRPASLLVLMGILIACFGDRVVLLALENMP